MNIVGLIGNLTAEPELRHTPTGHVIATFRIAVHCAGGAETAGFFDIVAWDRNAEFARTHLTKGRRVAVEGRLQHSTWTTEHGTRSKVEIVAHHLDPLTPATTPAVADLAVA